jgi:nucleoside phosphorylase
MSRPTNPQGGGPLDSSEDVLILQHDQYTIGWISALPIELAAAEGMLDVTHGPLAVHAADTNTYTLGSIGSHNIVVACLPRGHYGTNNAATVASNMRHSFPCIDRWLMVGIGGAAPHPDTLDIRLGDVVVSDQVLQYDFGKTLGDGEFELTSLPVRPSQALMTSVSKLQARHERESNQLEGLVATMMEMFPTMEAKFGRPKVPDCLFASSVPHVGSRPDCRACIREGVVERARRQDESQPRVHYGVIASGNQVIKDAVTRDRLATKHSIICFEMEAAGLMDTLRCLVIRGICDYADSHKNKQWQGYAATVAAAYAKALLTMLPSSQRMITSQSESKRKEVLLRSLYFDWMDARQGAIKAAHQQTCEWLLKNELYRHWTDAQEYAKHRGFFWITGKPGAGKSTLLKFAYTQAQQNWRTGDKAVVAFFFNARGTELEKTVKGMYRSILFQALQEMPSLQGVVLKALEDAHHPWVSSTSSKHDWDIQQLKFVLRTVIENL